jgi:ferredoxin
VSIEGQERTYSVEAGSNLFDALNKQGAKLPAGCLAGSCGACRIVIVRGPHNLSEPDSQEVDTVESIKVNYRRMYGPDHLKTENVRLSCRAIVNGDIMLKILD